MEETSTTPEAPGLPSDRLARIMAALSDDAHAVDVRWSGAHSNDVYDVRLSDGRRLMLKLGRHDWARERFAVSDAASRLLTSAGIVVPEPLALPQDPGERPMEAYWRIPLPTLEQLWPALSPPRRASAMHSLGRLLARVHQVHVEGWGGLANGGATGGLRPFLRRDIGERLLPACHGMWQAAVAPLERLLAMVPKVIPQFPRDSATLAHNDLHMGNVLCRVGRDGSVRCVGLLDLEAAVAAPPETDVASLEALHGPLFTQHVSPRWRAQVWETYDRPLDPRTVAFFRALHLANLGFHSALVGHHEHADTVARALHAAVTRLERAELRSDRDPMHTA